MLGTEGDPPRIGELQSSTMRRPGVMNTDGDGRQDEVAVPPRRSAVPPEAGLRRASRKRTRLVLSADWVVLDGSGASGVPVSADFFLFSADRKGVLGAAIAARSGVCSVTVAVAVGSEGRRSIEKAGDAESGAAGPSSRSGVAPAAAWQDIGVSLLPCPANSSSNAAPSLAPGDGLPGEGSASGGDGMAPRRWGVLAPPRASRSRLKAPCPAPGVANHIRGGDGAPAAGLGVNSLMALVPVRSKVQLRQVAQANNVEGQASTLAQTRVRSQ